MVLRGVVAGQTNQMIAEGSHVSERTVRRIIANLEEKFGVSNRALLIARASQLGLGS